MDRMEASEQIEGILADLSSMRDDITTLMADVDQVRSINISMLWSEIRLPDVPQSLPTCELRVEVLSGVGQQPGAIDDDKVDVKNEEDMDEEDTSKKQFYKENDQWIIVTLTELHDMRR